MSLLNNIVSEQVIHSLGWTIVHSLWQATLAAGLFFLLMLFLRKSSSRLRYYTGILTLLRGQNGKSGDRRGRGRSRRGILIDRFTGIL
jgi:hypothetical protein